MWHFLFFSKGICYFSLVVSPSVCVSSSYLISCLQVSESAPFLFLFFPLSSLHHSHFPLEHNRSPGKLCGDQGSGHPQFSLHCWG